MRCGGGDIYNPPPPPSSCLHHSGRFGAFLSFLFLYSFSILVVLDMKNASFPNAFPLIQNVSLTYIYNLSKMSISRVYKIE